MPRSGYLSRPIADFGGPTLNALNARNVRYFYQESGAGTGYPQCKVRTRAGHSNAFNPAAAVKSMYNFIATDPILSTPVNRVIYYTGAEIKTYDVLGNAIYSYNPALTIGTGFKASVAQAGTRAYIAVFDANGIGVSQGRVVDTLNQADKLFEAPPLTSTITITPGETGSGSVDAGTHNLAIIITTRTGYTTRPGPVDSVSEVFTPTLATTTGGKKLTVAINGAPWSTATSSVQLLMTTTTNLDKYFFVPLASFAVPGGTTFGFTLTVDISDASLTDQVPADDYFDRLSQDPISKGGPFSPSFVCAYGRRMVYGAGDRVYISDPDDFQAITADQHVVFLPGLLNIKTAFDGRDGNLYLVGDNWTYAVADNGDVPAAWAAPQLIDGKLGTVAVNGVVHMPSQNATLVATQSGLRLFQAGAYQDPPLTFWDPIWQSINWAAATSIEIMDDVERQTFRVLAPLGSATAPSDELTYHYKSGKTPDQVKQSRDSIAGRYCFELVESATSNRREVWLGPAASGQVWRRDESLTQDVGTNIAGQIYETQKILAAQELGGPTSFHGAHFTAIGTAVLVITGFNPGHLKNSGPRSTDLSTAVQGQRILRQWKMNADNESIEFKTDAGWFELDEVEPYYTPWLAQR